MHRIDSPGNQDGRFHPGNPAAGQRATLVDTAWLNAMQEAVVNVIEATGGQLAKGDDSQLYAAIVRLVSGTVGDGSGGVPTTRVVAAGGLVQGGGDLVSDRTFTVPSATTGDVIAGTRDDAAITPLGLDTAVGRSLNDFGYWAFKGVGIQWGAAYVAPQTSTNIVLPTSFQNQCVFADFNGPQLSSGTVNNPAVSNVGPGAITVFNPQNFGRAGRFLAIGI